MLAKRFRLKNKKAFDATYRQKCVSSTRLMTVYRGKAKSESSQIVKIGFVVSKKFHKRAVKRNRAKRLMREACRLLIKENGLCEDFMSYIFLPKEKILDASFEEIKTAVKKLVGKK